MRPAPPKDARHAQRPPQRCPPTLCSPEDASLHYHHDVLARATLSQLIGAISCQQLQRHPSCAASTAALAATIVYWPCARRPSGPPPSQKARQVGCAKHPGVTHTTCLPLLRVRMTCAAKRRKQIGGGRAAAWGVCSTNGSPAMLESDPRATSPTRWAAHCVLPGFSRVASRVAELQLFCRQAVCAQNAVCISAFRRRSGGLIAPPRRTSSVGTQSRALAAGVACGPPRRLCVQRAALTRAGVGSQA